MFFSAVANGQPTKAPNASDDFWYQPLSYAASGINVTPESAMRASACYACVKVLAETVASLPRMMQQRSADGTVQAMPSHPLQDVLDLSPNDNQTSFEFWEMQIAFGCLYGNSYAEIQPGQRGAVDKLIPLRPDYVRPEVLANGRVRYKYINPITQKETTYLQDEVFKIPGFSFNGIEGIAPIFFAKDPIGLALATEQFGAKFFTNDATPALVLEHPKTLSAGAVDRIKRAWHDMHAGLNNAYSVAVLEEDMKVKSLGIPNKDSQFLETRKYQIAEIARYLRVPLHMINELEKSSFSNIEQQSIEFVKYTIRPWLRRIEQRVSKDLITSNKFYLKHELDDLMQGEMLPRYQAYQIAATVGWLTRNEIRKREGANPLPGLDKPLTPMNMDNGGQGGADNAPAPSRTPQGGSATYRTVHEPLVVDAFTRILKSEGEALARMASKVSDDPVQAATGIIEFYKKKHTAHMAKVLQPHCAAAKAAGFTGVDLDAYCEQYVKLRLDDVIAAAPPMSYSVENVTTQAEAMAAGWFNLMGA